MQNFTKWRKRHKRRNEQWTARASDVSAKGKKNITHYMRLAGVSCMQEYVFLGIVLTLSLLIFWINRKRNAWDVMFFNTTLAIVVLFMVGLLENSVWDKVVYALGAVAVGSGIAAILEEIRVKS